MNKSVLGDLNIRELQKLAQKEVGRQRRDVSLSRAARLFLIHRLSQGAGAGLWAMLACAAALAVYGAQAAPGRAIVWAAMVVAAFLAARRLLSQFQLGERTAARPFGWRADYTASLVVFGAAYGSGALLLTPAAIGFAEFFAVLIVLSGGSIAAMVAHRAHLQAVLAVGAPVAGLCLLASLRVNVGAPFILPTAAAAAAVFAGAYLLNRRQTARARLRHPVDAFRSAIGVPEMLDLDETEAQKAGNSAA